MPSDKPAVFCVRNQAAKAADEHLSCPYCFGKTREVVLAGDRKLFCDFDPERDSVAFGFPEGTTRADRG